jgi:hypothetical protein
MICPDWRYVLGEPRLLHRVLAVGRQPLDGGYAGALEPPDRHRAGAHRLAVDVDRTGATLRDATTEFGASQSDCIAQRPKQWRIRLKIDLVLRSVDHKRDHRQDTRIAE